MEKLNKYLIEYIAQLTGKPQLMRVNCKFREIIKLKIPGYIRIKNLLIYLPFHVFPNFPEMKKINILDEPLTEYSFNAEKILVIYTDVAPDNEYVIEICARVKKHAVFYIHSGTIKFNHIDGKGICICKSLNGRIEMSSKPYHYINTHFGPMLVKNISQYYKHYEL